MTDSSAHLVATIIFFGSLMLSASAIQAGEAEELLAALSKGQELEKAGNYQAALLHYQRAMSLAPRVYGPSDAGTSSVLSYLAILHWKLGQYDKAEPLYRRVLMIDEANLGPSHPEVAADLNNLAALYDDTGDYAQAEALYLRSLRIRESRLGVDHPDVATSLNNLAILYKRVGKYEKAETLYQRCIKIRETKLGPESLVLATSLSNLGTFYLQMGQYAKAESLLDRSYKVRAAKLSPDHPDLASSLLSLAALYKAIGQYVKAESLLLHSLQVRESKLGPNHLDVAHSLNHLAELYRLMGRYAKAERLCQRALAIREGKLGADHPDIAESVHQLADLYWYMGQYDKAEHLFKRSIDISERKLGADHPDLAMTLADLATTYRMLKRYTEAESLYRRSLDIREKKLGREHPFVASDLNQLGFLFRETGKFRQAEQAHLRSLAISEKALGPEHLDVANALNGLALVYHAIGEYDKAKPLHHRCLSIYEDQLPSNHPDIAIATDALGRLLEAMGDTDNAAKNFERSRRVVRFHVTRVLPVLSDQEQITFIKKKDEQSFHSALTLVLSHADDVAVTERSAGWLANGKAVIQESLAEQSLLARDSHDAKLAAQIKQLLVVRNELANLSLATPETGKEAANRQRLEELSAKERELTRQVNSAAVGSTDDSPWIETSAVRAAIPTDARLVDIVRFSPYVFEAKLNENRWRSARYAAWVIPPAGKGDVRIIDLGEADKIDVAVEAARKEIERPAVPSQPADDEEVAEQAAMVSLAALAKLVLEPLLPAVGDARELIVSPDSQLWLVPWAALPVEDGKYAVERWRLRYMMSGRDVVAAASRGAAKQSKPTRPRIFADPDYDLDGKGSESATRAVLRGKEKQLAMRGAVGLSQSGLPRFKRLPATAEEARLITPSLAALAHEAPTVYSRQYALEGVLKVIESPRVLVLSTHGFYLPDQVAEKDGERRVIEADPATGRPGTAAPRRSAPMLSTDGKPLENPLLRCGVLLAGCNRRQRDAVVDDGIVTGMEIVGCDFRGTELVVLSACQTGLGQIRNGEGVAGLRQAFQLAGAKAVVSTLWRIPDEETVALMNDFFGQLAAGQSKAEALRAAQLAQIAARRKAAGAAHPYYWAAFTVTGN